jgi:hypothetical protein
MTKKYIGFKMVDAWESKKDDQEGYVVKYPDGYISWSPKDVFEKAYMEVGMSIHLSLAIRITSLTRRQHW